VTRRARGRAGGRAGGAAPPPVAVGGCAGGRAGRRPRPSRRSGAAARRRDRRRARPRPCQAGVPPKRVARPRRVDGGFGGGGGGGGGWRKQRRRRRQRRQRRRPVGPVGRGGGGAARPRPRGAALHRGRRARLVNSGCACSSGFLCDLMFLVGSSFTNESSLVTLNDVSLSGHPLAQAPVFHDGIPRGGGHQLCLTVWGTYRNGSFELFLSNSGPTRAASGRPRSPRNCASEARGQNCDRTNVLCSACITT